MNHDRNPTRTPRTRPVLLAVAALSAAVAAGCGPSQADYDALNDKYQKLAAETQAEKDARAKAEEELEAQRARVMETRKKLEQMGMNLDALNMEMAKTATEKERMEANLKNLQDALEEYRKRAEQLEAIQARFAELQKKLQKLVNLGLKVEVRHNRMVIRLPGDVLFASGKTELKDEGKEVIGAVAEVIRKDDGLAKRYFQVAGHTDDKPLKGGKYQDNWGLSSMRAREVLLFLVQGVDAGGGGLDAQKLHAAGYADIDPIAPNASPEGREQNRRVELVVLPDVSEMLDLTTMASAEPAPATPPAVPPAPGKKGAKPPAGS
jgi:chemotaxis protein MotB